MASYTSHELEYIINHLVLPPKLPQQAESTDVAASAERVLLDIVLSKVRHYLQRCTPDIKTPWHVVHDMFFCWISTKPHDGLSEQLLEETISKMKDGHVLPIRIPAQNAAIIMRKTDSAIIIESFELSSSSADVMSCTGSLRRKFPSHGLSIPTELAADAKFLHEFCITLGRLATETVDEMMPQTTKAGSSRAEIRDTCHPGLVTDMLMASLAAVGTPVKVPQVQKRIRDDVLWNNCRLPWRRSSLWLLAKISIQTTLARSIGSGEAVTQYKNFMIFLLTEILALATRLSISGDVCKTIQMKVARRAAKLGGSTLQFVQNTALAVIEKVSQSQDEEWQEIQRKDADRETKISLATMESDTILTLIGCRPALDHALREIEREPQPVLQMPSANNQWLSIPSDGFPVINSGLEAVQEKVYALAAFEEWLWNFLPSWLVKALHKPSAKQCAKIATAAETYRNMAMEVYSGCSEQLSLMLLAVGELWRALDSIAGQLTPLLHQHAPEIPRNIFHTLLLPNKAQMERLHDLESHIDRRHRNSRSLDSSVFADPSRSVPDCFASQFFDQSSSQQELHRQICADAEKKREEKKEEWQQSTNRYNELKRQYDALSQCDTTVNEYGLDEHNPITCRKCDSKRSMEQMTISIFEWPLPKDEVSRSLVVFELLCPAMFAAWRNLTWMLIHDLGRPRDTLGKPLRDRLDRYSGLSGYGVRSHSRIGLAASTKSLNTSHYRQLRFPVPLEKVCADHGIRWQYYDKTRGLWLSDQTEKSSFASKCETLLPEGPYTKLQYAVNSNAHSENAVLAAQVDCSPELSLHEYVAYGSLRADGEKTQWLNVCRELQASNLSWNTEAVCTLIRQTAWQVGSASKTSLRITHSFFEVPEFCTRLLSNISRVITSIQANRQSVYTMTTLVTLLLRTLSLAGDVVVSEALRLLRVCRNIVFQWMTGLSDALRSAADEIDISGTRRSLLRVALLCKLTFDVDTEYITDVLVSAEDLHCWTTSSMIVYENTPGAESTFSADLRRLLLHDRKLSHALHRRLQDLFTATTNTGLDRAILGTWSGFKSSDQMWKFHGSTASLWLCKTTPPSPHHASQTIYYNVLSGQVLVDGRPLGTLPKKYTSHSLFVRIFGAQILRVAASNMAGMLYMTTNEEYGYSFHFVMNEADLVIRAESLSTIFELIPHQRFESDFPTTLVQDYVHWLDLRANEIEFRPLAGKWTTSSENWRLQYSPQGESQLHNGEMRLIDIRSQTFQRTLDVFGGLERAEYVHAVKASDGILRVDLPRLGLHFFTNSAGDLECQELRKIVDPDQSVGTLVGLKSRLVLCAKGDQSRSLDRIILIPNGEISTRCEDSHLCIEIATSGRDVRCLRYAHNATLNRLDADGSMVSRLFQAYLHALTSFILPDPLTGILGTEESLRILEEQKSRCCKPLEAAEIDLLELIAGLTPQRVFFPAYLKVMQQVLWHENLSQLSQVGEFADLAEGILAQAQHFGIFYSDVEPVRALARAGDQSLQRRAKLRNAAYFNAEYIGNERSAGDDVEYNTRDGSRNTDQATRVFAIASLIVAWSTALAVPPPKLAHRWRSWGTVFGIGTVFNFTPSIADLLNISFSSSWAPLYGYCRQATREKTQYKLLFLFSFIAYGSQISSIDDLKTLLAFATNPSLQALPPFPDYPSFTLGRGSTLDRDKLLSIIAARKQPFSAPKRGITAAVRRQRLAAHESALAVRLTQLVEFYSKQWPCTVPSSIPSDYSQWIKTENVSQAVRDLFADWYRNQKCEQHLALIQDELDTMTTATTSSTYELTAWHQCELLPRHNLNQSLPTLSSLMASRTPIMSTIPLLYLEDQQTKVLESSEDLRSLILNFHRGSNSYDGILRTKYRDDLLASLDACHSHSETILPQEIPRHARRRAFHDYETCQNKCLMELDLLCDELEPQDPISRILRFAGLWPRLRVCDLLSVVSSISQKPIPGEWKKCIITLGSGITVLQRARRLVLAAEKGDVLSFFKEFENPGRLGWSAFERPDWLLMEIENDLLIRPIQARVASEMIEPSEAANTLMQLNMGEGKSSVIIPLIAAALANGQQISRVVVLRSLNRQMQDTLVQRLGGLARRRIYYMPFSRKTNMSASIIQRMKAMYVECMTNRGILIAQPEHILSFKLMGIERLTSMLHSCDDDESTSESYMVATELLDTQGWLEKHCRDVLDESDEILDVKFQLIYTLGAQRSMDGQPDRWLMMESVFDIVERQAYLLQRLHPGKIEIDKQTSSSFPTIRMPSTELRQALVSGTFQEVCDSKVAGFVMSALPADVKEAAAAFIAEENVAEDSCRIVQAHCSDDDLYLKKLLFLRGLIAGGILLHALCDKRWSVNYGLHLTRCLCAVPYRAKGVPAPTAEFGHPDVTIALTCLSYYYNGLTDTQIRSCLGILQKADDPTAEFDPWVLVDADSFPEALRHWSAVNLEDQQQCEHLLFPALRFNKKTADFFMTNVVFPKEGKEFDQKLSTSGWDIPARPTSQKVTTGFSGTNDNRFLLPSIIAQHDLPELRHTSGKVLEFVSRPENLGYTCARDDKGAHLSTEALLQFIQSSDANVRVLIDVGAQILDLANDQVIGRWLTLVPDADAGVYFDENDYAMVLSRSGKKEKLGTSAFSNRMDRCLVYLDDVHTRGTDLKLPPSARAAVTLGPRLTKDRLVQACMRLRQLGHGQSLMFFAPPEVHQEIANIASTDEFNGIQVIRWALEQSCLHIQRNQPLRVMQGLHYFQRLEIVDELNQCLATMAQTDHSSSLKELGQRVIEHEAQTLQNLYAPESMRGEDQSGLIKSSRLKSDAGIRDLIKVWDQLDISVSHGANLHEEHEREIAHEVEQETRIERPPRATPRTRRLDEKIRHFIRFGSQASATSLASVYPSLLQQSSAAMVLKGQSQVWENVRVSQGFIDTVKRGKQDSNDSYLRPVHWVLVSKEPAVQMILLISQFEVNKLFDKIQAPSSRVALICYEPQVTRSMQSLDASPSHPLPHARKAWDGLSANTKQDLHLFAGQLYFTTFDDYVFLTRTLVKQNAIPLLFIKEWMGIRRKGANFLPTHVGQVVGGRVLQRDLFERGQGENGMADNISGAVSQGLFVEAEGEDEVMTG